MVIFVLANLVLLSIAVALRRRTSILWLIIAVGAYGFIASLNQSVSLTRSNAPPRKLVDVTKDYADGYSAAVDLVKRGSVIYATLYAELVIISIMAIRSRRKNLPLEQR